MHTELEDFDRQHAARAPAAPAGRATSNVMLAKLEGNNPAGSVKDRPALSMIARPRSAATIKPGDTLIEATSRQHRHRARDGGGDARLPHGPGHARAPVARAPPDDARVRRRAHPHAARRAAWSRARDIAEQMQREGKGVDPRPVRQSRQSARRTTRRTGPEIWRDTDGRITHFVSQHGHDRHDHGRVALPEGEESGDPDRRRQPDEGSQIPGIRKWPEAYLPKIFDGRASTALEYVSQADAEDMTRRLAREEGIFAGISSGGALRGRAAHRARRSRTRRSCSSSATAATATCPPACFPPDGGMTPILVFDIETVPDVAGLRQLHDLHADVAGRGRASSPSQQRRAHDRQRFPAAAPAARGRRSPARCASDDGVRVWSLGEPERRASPSSIQRFFDGIEKYTPQLVSWNGGGFDLPVLHYRGLIHGVAARATGTGATTTATSSSTTTSPLPHAPSRPDGRARDVPAARGAPLDAMAQLCGFPGKLGMDGTEVWHGLPARARSQAIRNYCETDVLNTYLLYLRFQLMRGGFDRRAYDARDRARARARSASAPSRTGASSCRSGRPDRCDIESLDAEGRGVAHNADGKVVFVEGALPGERGRGRASLRKQAASYEIGARSPRSSSARRGRRAPRCPHFGVCGGCKMQHVDVARAGRGQAARARGRAWRHRQGAARDAAAPIDGPAWGYRHRARLSVRHVSKKGGALVGFHERSSSYVADMRELRRAAARRSARCCCRCAS